MFLLLPMFSFRFLFNVFNFRPSTIFVLTINNLRSYLTYYFMNCFPTLFMEMFLYLVGSSRFLDIDMDIHTTVTFFFVTFTSVTLLLFNFGLSLRKICSSVQESYLTASSYVFLVRKSIVIKKEIVWQFPNGYCLCYCKTFQLVPVFSGCAKY